MATQPAQDYLSAVQKAAASTRKTTPVDTSVLKKSVSSTPAPAAPVTPSKKIFGPRGVGAAQPTPATTTPSGPSSLQGVASAAIANYGEQAKAQKAQAEKAASALEMVGEATQRSAETITNIQDQLRQQVASAAESFDAAAEKADEYVTASRGRVREVLNKLDEINKDFTQERSFAKAHAMQASVQATLGTMKAEGRNIAETYGIDSPEYQQFQASKRQALGTVQSNVHASFQQLAEDQHKTYLSVTSDAYTKSNMYVGYQEQQHVEMLKYADQAKTAYTLQATQLEASLEQMKLEGTENLANWIIETPSFTMDMTPLATLLADIQSTQQTLALERERVAATLEGSKAQAEAIERAAIHSRR